MAMCDWISNYPGVAALLQQETDVLAGVSVEDEDAGALGDLPAVPPEVQASVTSAIDATLQSLLASAWVRTRRAEVDYPPQAAALAAHAWALTEQWFDKVCAWATTMWEQHGPTISVHILVAPDVFHRLAAFATPPGGPGQLHIDVWTSQFRLTLCGRITVSPFVQCPPGTWLCHWSASATHETLVACAPGVTRWTHLVHAPVSDDEACISPVAQTCTAIRPALTCPCGGHLLDWY